MYHVPLPSGAPEWDALDLASIPGVPDHYYNTGEVPILVFRCARQIRIVQNPFPGVWKLTSATESRSLIAGRNTFPNALELQAGDEVTITPIMSAVAPTGPRIQVPAELVDDMGELESIEDLPDVANGEKDAGDGPTDTDIDVALGWYRVSPTGGAQ